MSYNYSDPPGCCSSASTELRLYQAFIFSIPIFFTCILLFLFYLFYLRRRRVDWSSLRMRASPYENNPRLSESGLKKELREMLPIIVFKETFSIRDTQCSVCLGDYQAEEKLQQIPACGHTFHMDCIDHWLATHTTCPLCRLSLVPPPKADSDQVEAQDLEAQTQEGASQAISGEDVESHRREEATAERELGAANTGRTSHSSSGNDHCVCSEEEELHTDTAMRGDEEEGEVVSVVVHVDVEAQSSTLQETSTREEP